MPGKILQQKWREPHNKRHFYLERYYTTQTKPFATAFCSVADNDDVHWTSWTAWSVCTGVDGKDCGPGHRILRRECRRDRGGQLCQIDGRQEDYRNEDCFLKPCPPPPGELEICLSSHYCPVPAELKLGQSVPMVPRS